jgi:glycosyltransferase involved in cell wall biosynthesis
MCTCNGATYLAQQLASIARQDRPPDELIICDDHSNDATVAIAHDFAATATFPVRIIVNPEQLGVVRNFANAIARCEGELIALADQDDEWRPSKIAEVERAFDDPDVGLVFSDADVVNQRLEPTGERLWARIGLTAARRRAIERDMPLTILWPGWFVTGATMALRSRFRSLILPIPTDLPMIHDGWIAAVVSGVARVRALDAPLIRYRQHPAQQIGAPARPAAQPAIGALDRRNDYRRQLLISERLHHRLSSQTAFPVQPQVLRALGDQIRHLSVRSSLAQNPVTRLHAVFGELMAGRYHRCSRGLRSAVKDALVGHRSRNGD